MLKIVSRRFAQNLSPYLSVILGLAIGTYLFSLSFSVASALDSRLFELESQSSDKSIRADIPSSLQDDLDFAGLGKDDAECKLGLSTIVHIGANRAGMPDSIIFVTLPDFYFEELFGFESTDLTAYCTPDLLESLQSGELRLFPTAFELDYDGEYLYLDALRLSVHELDTSRDSSPTTFLLGEDLSDDISLDRLIFLPESAGALLVGETFRSHSLYARPASPDAHAEAYRLIYRVLNGIPPIISDPAARHMKACLETTDLLVLTRLTAICLLIVTLLGTVGILILTLSKRRRELAISASLGATRLRISIELILELLCICLPGVLIGAGLCIPTLPPLEAIIPHFEAARSASPMLAAVPIALVMITLTSLPMLSQLHRLDIAQILKGEE